MDDSISRPRRGRLPAGFLGAVAMMIAIEATIAHQKLGSFGGSQWSYDVARTVADSGDRTCEVVCFGDSLLKQGLAPPIFEAKAGLKGYNFAIAGGQAPGDYFLLRRALESGIRPKAIVVEYFPKLMATDPDFNIENWPFLASPADCLELARLTHNPSLLTELALREVFPSIRCRNSIRANVLAALNGTFPTFAHEILSARRNWEVNRGAEILIPRPGRVDDIEIEMRGYFPSFACTKTNRTYIKKLVELAARHEIPVFWVLPPYQPALQARVEQSGFDAAHEAFVKGLQSRYPGLYVIDARRAGYDPGVFTDLHHLGREGAAIFSGEVAHHLRQHREAPASTPRWHTLAAYRAAPVTPPLEDMEESRRKIFEIAVKGNGTFAR